MTDGVEPECPECGRGNVLKDGDSIWCIEHGWQQVDTAADR